MIEKITSWLLGNRTYEYDNEELTGIGLMAKITTKTNETIDKVNSLDSKTTDIDNKKVSIYDLENNRHLSAVGDFTGTWFGHKMVESDIGLSSIVADHEKMFRNMKVINVASYTTVAQAFADITDNSLVLFPQGNYVIENMPDIIGKTNLYFIGFGANLNAKLISNDSTNGVMYNTIFKLFNCTDVTIEGLTLNGGITTTPTQVQTTTSHSKLLWAEGCNNLKILNTKFTGHATNRALNIGGSDASVLIKTSNDVTFKDCQHINNYMEGIWIENSNNVIFQNLKSVNPNIWSALDLFGNNGIRISNAYVYSQSGADSDTATVNLFCDNASIENSQFYGGAGFDFSDEANYINRDVSNIVMKGCYLKAKYGFHTSGTRYAKDVKIVNNLITANFGFYLYMTDQRVVDGVLFEGNTFNVINAIKYRALGGSYSKLSNITFSNNKVNCKTIAESQAYQSWLNSGNGASSGFVFAGETNITSGNEIVENITIKNNEVYCEGSGFNVYQVATYFKCNNLVAKDNKFYNHPSKLTTPVDGAFYAVGVTGLTVEGNYFVDAKTANMVSCSDITIKHNRRKYINVTQATRGYYMTTCTGRMMCTGNLSNGTNNEHIQGFNNTFAEYLLNNNLPATYYGITAV